MKRTFKYILLVAATVILVACPGPDIPEILDDETPSLTVKGVRQFRFNELTCQESFSISRKEFRAGDDKMSNYFVLTLNQLPVTEGMSIKGNLQWTTDDDVRTLKNLTFSVLKKDENQTVWLKCEAENIYVVARMVY